MDVNIQSLDQKVSKYVELLGKENKQLKKELLNKKSNNYFAKIFYHKL